MYHLYLQDADRCHQPVHADVAGGGAEHVLRQAHLPNADGASNLRGQDPAHWTHGSASNQVMELEVCFVGISL